MTLLLKAMIIQSIAECQERISFYFRRKVILFFLFNTLATKGPIIIAPHKLKTLVVNVCA